MPDGAFSRQERHDKRDDARSGHGDLLRKGRVAHAGVSRDCFPTVQAFAATDRKLRDTRASQKWLRAMVGAVSSFAISEDAAEIALNGCASATLQGGFDRRHQALQSRRAGEFRVPSAEGLTNVIDTR